MAQRLILVGIWLAFAALAAGQPGATAWPTDGAERTSAVAGASVAGFAATADTGTDRVEVRDTRGGLVGVMSRAQISALLPWMSLDGSEDGPASVCLTDSGRLAFVAVRDDEAAPDGQPGDAVLRWEVETGDLRVFARVELGASAGPGVGLAHFRGRLYVGMGSETRAYSASANTLAGTVLAASATGTRGFAVDRDAGMIYAIDGAGNLVRAPEGLSTISFATIAPAASLAGATSVAWSDHFGGPGQGGLYARREAGGASAIAFFPAATVRAGSGAFSVYVADAGATLGTGIGAIAATADGGLLAARADGMGAVVIRDGSDARLGFEAWAADEFAEQVRFAKSLISPDGEPPGWVIDADVQVGWTRFHPASPDAACWAVLMLMMSEELTGDVEARPLVRTILQRYAGRSPDGIVPLRSSEGIYWHWLDPMTGGPKAGWGDGYATLSTMKIVLAAARAVRRWPTDGEIRASAEAIICGVGNWEGYFTPAGTRGMYFLGQPTGGPLGGASSPFHEGIIFAEQAGAYGGAAGGTAWAYWLNRNNHPVAATLTGRLVTTGSFGVFQPAFVSLYSLLVQGDVRARADWREHYRNLRLSHAAWTDDHGPRYSTVFSAGTTRGDWGGYHADSLTTHPGDVTTLTSLLAMSAGDGGAGGAHVGSAGGAYQAYRRGARQTFLGGASILYRRSQVDLAYQPNSAGLPDVTLGGLGLAEVISAGSVGRVLTGAYPSCESLGTPVCAADFNGDGNLDPDDLGDYINCYFSAGCVGSDFNGDGNTDPDDLGDFINGYFAGC